MDSFLEVMKNTVEALGAKYEFDAEEAMTEIDMTPFEGLLKAKKSPGKPSSGGGGSADEDPEKEAKRLAKNAAAKAKRDAAKAEKVKSDPTMAPKKAPSKKKISSESLDAAKESGVAAAAAIGASASASASEKPKRVLSEEQKEKMRLGRERKKAEKEAAAAAGTV